MNICTECSLPVSFSRYDPKDVADSVAGSDWWSVEPDVGRVAYGIPRRVDRLRGLGNAIVPQVVYPIFQAIVEIEEGRA